MQRHLGRLRLVAVLAVVVVSLTGFQSRSRIHRHSTSSGGGGCSSSHSTSHSYRSATTGSPTTSATTSSTDATAQITIVSCTDPDTGKPAPQLRIDNSGGTGAYYFSAVVRMSGKSGSAVGTATLEDTLVAAGEIKTVGAVVTGVGGAKAPASSSGCSLSSATKEAA
jgi:hypothetical protein